MPAIDLTDPKGSSQYDAIAEMYATSKTLPIRIFFERPTLFSLVGPVENLSVLDMACGDGIYSRHLRHTLGAAKVVGIDNSKSMITLAQQAENIRTAGHRVEYVHGDAASVSQIAGGGFDLVLGAYLFNYAQTEEELEKFFQTVFVNLKPGGRLVAINDNMTDDPSLYHPVLDTWKYGYRKSVEGGVGRKEGAKILYECADARGNVFSFANYWLKVETYERVMRRVGFTSWKWIDVRVNEEGLARFGGDFWQNLLANRTMICLEACK